MKPVFSCVFLLFFSILLAIPAQATHLLGGQITARHDSASTDPLAYVLIMTVYRETLGVDQPDAEIGIAQLSNGSWGADIARVKANAGKRRVVGRNIEEMVFTFPFTFPAPGSYRINFKEENRNAELVNASNSVYASFYLETYLVINPSLGVNHTPYLLNPPVEPARAGQKFCHNAAAFDVDGDSIAYRLAVPSVNEYQAVENYKFPHQVGPSSGTPESGTGTPTFGINSLTGDLCWDSPGTFGMGAKGYATYAVAFVVEEWRKTANGYVKISDIKRDMTIDVRDNENKRPILTVPKDTIVVAGNLLQATIRAMDTNNSQQIRISSESAGFSQMRSIFPYQPAATLSVENYPPTLPEGYAYAGNPSENVFSWQTSCDQVRNQPYDLVFKAEDNVNPAVFQLTDTKTWRVFVIGTAPTNVQAKANVSTQTIDISWQPYACNVYAKLYIWRQEGCSTQNLGTYTVGNPTGYVLVGKVNASVSTFSDNLAKPGVNYHYRVSASMENNIHSLSASTYCNALAVTSDTPTITITTPTNDASFTAPATIAISATTTGSIAKVEFYSNGAKLGEDTSAPYSYTWNGVPYGTYSIVAKAVGSTGSTGISLPVEITVTDIVNGSEEEEERLLLAFPNPFQNELRIRYMYPIKHMCLVNLLGVVSSLDYQSVGNSVYTSSTGNLPPGVYILKVKNATGREIIRKLIKL